MSLSLSRKRRSRENQDVPSTSKRTRESQDILSQSQVVSSERCGKIIRIHLENFMCHANLTIEFHQRVNFLVGSNGSGKSAIMAALVLGLGSKAAATNRSGSMKQFIKTGENSSKIEITISNKGFEAYEPETYGEKITVVRNINQTSACYTIKNEHGRVVSRKLEDLCRILEFHNIQTENPIFVLNQDSAREFLKELDPKKNYKMFVAATQIEQIAEKLYGCLHSHKEQRIRLQSFKKKILKMQKEMNELNGKFDILLNLEKHKETLKTLEVERMWLIAILAEKDLSDITQSVEESERKVIELQRVASSKSALETELTSQIRKYEHEKADKEKEYAEHRTLQMELKNKSSQFNQHKQEIELSIQRFKKKKSYLEAATIELQNHIDERVRILNTDEIKRKHESNLENLKKSFQEIEIMIETTNNDFKSLIESKTQTEDILNNLRATKITCQTKITSTNAIISNINLSSKDPLSTYGNEMVQLVSEIQRQHKAGRFTELPRGPIGQYVHVPNTQYRDLVETQLGNLVKAFIVCNSKDRKTLESVFQKICPQLPITIITMKFANKVYDISKGCVRPPSGTRVLMNEIKCSDPVVLNCIIDRINIEAVLLTDNKTTAENICQRENIPVNMLKVLVPNYNLEYFPEPKYRMYSMQIRPGRYIQVGVKQRIKGLQHEKEKSETELANVESQLHNFIAKQRDNDKQITLLSKKKGEQEAKRFEIQSEIDEINNFEYPHHNEIDILLAEVNDNKNQMSSIDTQIENSKKDLNNLLSNGESLNIDISVEANKMEAIQKEFDEIDKNIDISKSKIKKIATTFNEAKKQMEVLKETIKSQKQEKQNKQLEMRTKVEQAKEFGEKVQSDRDVESIEDDIAKIQAKLKLKRNINENVEELQKKISEKKKDIDMELKMYEKLKLSVDLLGKSLRSRFYFLQNLKQHMALLLQYAFNYYLKARDFEGSVEVNHQEQTLVLSVIPRDKHLESALSNTRALSGGERSYATIAFLVSLWSCVDHPFYFLDEYDVFTDVVNRESLTQLLLNEGKVRPNRQFTFLTPQDMSLHSNDIVRIHRLQPPEKR